MFSLFKKPRYHSAFGGLWIDRLDAAQQLARRRTRLTEPLAQQVAAFMAEGYLILPSAVDSHLTARIGTIMTAAFSHGDARLRYQRDGSTTEVMDHGTDPRGARIVEGHAVLADVREAFAAAPIVAFLRAIFEETPALSQSLMFQVGSEQCYHRDTTFVRFDAPLCMVGCWIALEDVRAGSGELSYIPGSHRLPDFPFANGRKDGVQAAPAELEESLAWTVAESDRRGLSRKTFSAKTGDALIWHADLAHGGLPITAPHLTRQSIVGHLSPYSVGRSAHRGSEVRRRHGPICYSSTYYDVGKVL